MLVININEIELKKLKTGKEIHTSIEKSEYMTKKLLRIFQKYSLIKLKNIRAYSIPAEERIKCRLNKKYFFATVTRFSLSPHGSLVYTEKPVYELTIELLESKINIFEWFKLFRRKA